MCTSFLNGIAHVGSERNVGNNSSVSIVLVSVKPVDSVGVTILWFGFKYWIWLFSKLFGESWQ